jgi:stearoyl-CoA desaturase (delta-9 desaturase)
MKSKIDKAQSTPFILMHVLAPAAFLFSWDWKMPALCLASYLVRMFGITAGFHRYFSHRTFHTSRAGQFALAVLGGTAFQKGALWWAANHRHHHRESDKNEDVHSPLLRGFWWSHVQWFLSNDYDATDLSRIKDLSRYPELVWLNRYHWVPGTLYAALILALFGWVGFFWGFVLSTVLLWHGTFAINSLAHVFGKQRYDTGDKSANNFWLALVTLGEGWHNNHHCYMSSTRQGFFWWEIDLTYYALKCFEKFGLVWSLREPPLADLVSRQYSSVHGSAKHI